MVSSWILDYMQSVTYSLESTSSTLTTISKLFYSKRKRSKRKRRERESQLQIPSGAHLIVQNKKVEHHYVKPRYWPKKISLAGACSSKKKTTKFSSQFQSFGVIERTLIESLILHKLSTKTKAWQHKRKVWKLLTYQAVCHFFLEPSCMLYAMLVVHIVDVSKSKVDP